MGAVDRGVHAHHPVDLPGSVGVCEQLGVDLVPRPIARITAMPLLHRLPWAERTRHVTPRRADTVTPDDALDHTAIIPERATPPPGRRWQQQPNPIPLSIRQHTIATHTRVIPPTEPGIRRHALVQRVIPLRHASQGAPRTTIATQHPPSTGPVTCTPAHLHTDSPPPTRTRAVHQDQRTQGGQRAAAAEAVSFARGCHPPPTYVQATPTGPPTSPPTVNTHQDGDSPAAGHVWAGPRSATCRRRRCPCGGSCPSRTCVLVEDTAPDEGGVFHVQTFAHHLHVCKSRQVDYPDRRAVCEHRQPQTARPPITYGDPRSATCRRSRLKELSPQAVSFTCGRSPTTYLRAAHAAGPPEQTSRRRYTRDSSPRQSHMRGSTIGDLPPQAAQGTVAEGGVLCCRRRCQSPSQAASSCGRGGWLLGVG